MDDFRANPEEYLAKVAVGHANVMAARMWHHYQGTPRDYGAKSEGQYREAITANECADFGLVRDIADGFKHVKLTRPSRRVTSADQTGARHVTFTNGRGEAVTFVNDRGDGVVFLGPVIVELDDGTTRPLLPVLEAVVAMWDRLSAR